MYEALLSFIICEQVSNRVSLLLRIHTQTSDMALLNSIDTQPSNSLTRECPRQVSLDTATAPEMSRCCAGTCRDDIVACVTAVAGAWGARPASPSTHCVLGHRTCRVAVSCPVFPTAETRALLVCHAVRCDADCSAGPVCEYSAVMFFVVVLETQWTFPDSSVRRGGFACVVSPCAVPLVSCGI